MTELVSGLQAALNTARKGKDKDRTLLLGTVLSAVKNHGLALTRPLNDDDVLAVLQRAVKQRRESVDQFTSGGRPDLAERELAQIKIIAEFLPPPASDDDIRRAVREARLGGAAQIGALMAAVVPRFKGRADGKDISRIVREELQAG